MTHRRTVNARIQLRAVGPAGHHRILRRSAWRADGVDPQHHAPCFNNKIALDVGDAFTQIASCNTE